MPSCGWRQIIIDVTASTDGVPNVYGASRDDLHGMIDAYIKVRKRDDASGDFFFGCCVLLIVASEICHKRGHVFEAQAVVFESARSAHFGGIEVYIHACIHAYTYIHVRACTHTHTHMSMHACIHEYTHTDIVHTYVRT